MTVQTLKIGKERLIVLREQDYKKLLAQIGTQFESDAPDSMRQPPKSPVSAEDRRDAKILRMRLADMRRRGEKPVPYARVRKEMGLG